MNNPLELKVAQVSRRGNKFAVVAGRSILMKFKTVEAAFSKLESHRSFFEYWANSCSVSVENGEWRIIDLDC